MIFFYFFKIVLCGICRMRWGNLIEHVVLPDLFVRVE